MTGYEELAEKLREAGLVESRIVLLEDEARALRFYKLVEFEVHVSPETLGKEVK